MSARTPHPKRPKREQPNAINKAERDVNNNGPFDVPFLKAVPFLKFPFHLIVAGARRR
jgi:hypothetical protein